MMPPRSKRRDRMPYRVLHVVIVGGILALLIAAFSSPLPLAPRTLLVVLAGLLLVLAVLLEVVFRDIARLRERVRQLEQKNRG